MQYTEEKSRRIWKTDMISTSLANYTILLSQILLSLCSACRIARDFRTTAGIALETVLKTPYHIKCKTVSNGKMEFYSLDIAIFKVF